MFNPIFCFMNLMKKKLKHDSTTMMTAPLPVRNPKSNTQHPKNQQSVMQLRSGTVISRPSTVSVPNNEVIGRANIRDHSYTPGVRRLAEKQVREKLKRDFIRIYDKEREMARIENRVLPSRKEVYSRVFRKLTDKRISDIINYNSKFGPGDQGPISAMPDNGAYNPSKIELAKRKVREQVRERQRKMADKHSNKAVDQAMGMFDQFIKSFNATEKVQFDQFINSFNAPEKVQSDTLMDKIRIITMMYEYANSLSTYTMMNSRLINLRIIMLKQCKNFSKDATTRINGRIKEDQDDLTDKEFKSRRNYYTFCVNMMQAELDKFTNTYANRL